MKTKILILNRGGINLNVYVRNIHFIAISGLINTDFIITGIDSLTSMDVNIPCAFCIEEIPGYYSIGYANYYVPKKIRIKKPGLSSRYFKII